MRAEDQCDSTAMHSIREATGVAATRFFWPCARRDDLSDVGRGLVAN